MNLKINDTTTEKYIYNYEIAMPTYDENTGEVKNIKYENRERFFEIDYYEDKILKNENVLMLPGNTYYLKSKENIKDLKEEVERYFIENNIKYEIKEISSGKLY